MTDSPTGHRQRLKERFLAGQGTGLADYELLELTLSFAIPRKDVKPLAKTLITQFGSLSGVLTATPEALAAVSGLGPHSVSLLTLVAALARRTTRQKLADQPLLATRLDLLDYLYTLFAGKAREELHVLFLTTKLQLITDETLFTGTLSFTAANPREILKKALAHNAAGLIVAHNHPSGVPTPSGPDLTFTTQLASACTAMGLTLHDHLIIGTDQHFSFKGAGHL